MTMYFKIRFWTDSESFIKYFSGQDYLEKLQTIPALGHSD